MGSEGTKADGKHVLAYCMTCGNMTTPVDGEWFACHCGGKYFVFPHVALRDDFPWKLTSRDKELFMTLFISMDGFVQ